MGRLNKLALFGVKKQNTMGDMLFDNAKDLDSMIKSYENTQVNKSIGKSDKTKTEPILGMIGQSPEFREKSNYTQSMRSIHEVLKRFGNNIIINAIINTRSDQVALYCQPSRYSKKGMGFEVRLKDVTKTPGANEKKEIERIEDFLNNTSGSFDINRDTFYDFCKKIVRDTLIYDQVNVEKNINRRTNKLESFTAVDPTTIFYKTRDNKLIHQPNQAKYVQVLNNEVVNEYTQREMIMGIRRPRTDIYSSGYGLSELEIALKQVIAHENTESFNDRFFSHGGTTRGVLLIKHEQQQSQYALENFKREWKSSLSGINGSWQIPVVSADDVKFVNMTPTANDMQFEKWLNYLINVICSVYEIDPSEVNFPNRGGATGSKANSLNEGDSTKKHRDSQNKGLQPLLKFIETLINKHIISEFGDKYVFEFNGGDTQSEIEKLQIQKLKTEIGITPDELRQELGYEGKVPGGDIIQTGVAVQRAGQLAQEQLQREQKKMQSESSNQENELESTKPSSHYSTNNDSDVGKDGQSKDETNANSYDQSNKD